MSSLHKQWASILCGLTVTTFSICMATASRADEITFKIAIYPNAVSNGSIWMKTSEKTWYEAYTVPPQGTLKVTVSCAAGTFFKARINDDYLPFDGSHIQKGCAAGEIPFLFREKVYVALIKPAKTGEALAGIDAGNEVVAWQQELTAALAQDDSESVLKRSSQIYNFLIGSGKYSVAEKYRVLNFDKAKSALGGGELTFDASQNRYVLSKEDEKLIKRIQAENKLKPSGKLDWATMETVAKTNRPDVM